MLAKRIIPCLDVTGGRVVKGVNFVELRDAGDPVECAKAYQAAGADEIAFLDISATTDARKTAAAVVARVAKAVTVPLIVGGGMRSVEDIRDVLDAGAVKVSLNTAAVRNPQLVKSASDIFGKERIIVAIDAKRKGDGYWQVCTEGGMKAERLDVVGWAALAQRLGAGEILLTSIDMDGTKGGYDIELTEAVSSRIDIPVTASGGAGCKEDFYKALTAGGAAAALAASLFHFKEVEIAELKKYLADKGVAVCL